MTKDTSISMDQLAILDNSPTTVIISALITKLYANKAAFRTFRKCSGDEADRYQARQPPSDLKVRAGTPGRRTAHSASSLIW